MSAYTNSMNKEKTHMLSGVNAGQDEEYGGGLIHFLNPNTVHEDPCCVDPTPDQFMQNMLRVNAGEPGMSSEVPIEKNEDLVTYFDSLLVLLIETFFKYVYCSSNKITEPIKNMLEKTAFEELKGKMIAVIGDVGKLSRQIDEFRLKHLFALLYFIINADASGIQTSPVEILDAGKTVSGCELVLQTEDLSADGLQHLILLISTEEKQINNIVKKVDDNYNDFSSYKFNSDGFKTNDIDVLRAILEGSVIPPLGVGGQLEAYNMLGICKNINPLTRPITPPDVAVLKYMYRDMIYLAKKRLEQCSEYEKKQRTNVDIVPTAYIEFYSKYLQQLNQFLTTSTRYNEVKTNNKSLFDNSLDIMISSILFDRIIIKTKNLNEAKVKSLTAKAVTDSRTIIRPETRAQPPRPFSALGKPSKLKEPELRPKSAEAKKDNNKRSLNINMASPCPVFSYISLNMQKVPLQLPDFFSKDIIMFDKSSRIFCDQYIESECSFVSTFCIVEDWAANSKEDLVYDTVPSSTNPSVDTIEYGLLLLEQTNTGKPKETKYLRPDAPLLGEFINQPNLNWEMNKDDRSIFNKLLPTVRAASPGYHDGINLKMNEFLGSKQEDFRFYNVSADTLTFLSSEDTRLNGYKSGEVDYDADTTLDKLADIPFVNKDDGRTYREIKFDKVFNISSIPSENHPNILADIANNIMLERSILFLRGSVILTYGGSGTGKTSLLFGKKAEGTSPMRQGLLTKLLLNINTKHPLQERLANSTMRIDISVHETLYNTAYEFDTTCKYLQTEMHVNDIVNIQDIEKVINDFKLEQLDEFVEARAFQVPITSETDITHTLVPFVQKIDQIMNRLRAGETIISTVNNPQSSRSAIIYTFRAVYEVDTGQISIPIHVVDLPGYERESIEGDRSKWINKLTTESLELIKEYGNKKKSLPSEQSKFLTRLGIDSDIYMIDLAHTTIPQFRVPRLYSINMLNRRGANGFKNLTLKSAVLAYIPSVDNTGKHHNAMRPHGMFLKFPTTETKQIKPASAENAELAMRAGLGSTTQAKKPFGTTTWKEFLSLKSALLQAYFDLQYDQRKLLDLMYASYSS